MAKVTQTLNPDHEDQIRIVAILPNPPGNETQNEEITVKNFSGVPVSLVNWKVRDLTGKTWSLNQIGTLSPGQEKGIKRNGQPMALNNNGDTIDLLNSNDLIIQTVTYSRAEEDEIIFPNL